MSDLRFTDTNAADDSGGRVFGLDGNLYLPVVIAALGAVGTFVLLGYLFRTGWITAAVGGTLPLATTLGWVGLLRHGKPAGYDRDKLEDLAGGGHFT
ncbi:MAG: hypothetical protein PSW75_05190, partial [bacterium]|nr:hypothetical protein [bacterium]